LALPFCFSLYICCGRWTRFFNSGRSRIFHIGWTHSAARTALRVCTHLLPFAWRLVRCYLTCYRRQVCQVTAFWRCLHALVYAHTTFATLQPPPTPCLPRWPHALPLRCRAPAPLALRMRLNRRVCLLRTSRFVQVTVGCPAPHPFRLPLPSFSLQPYTLAPLPPHAQFRLSTCRVGSSCHTPTAATPPFRPLRLLLLHACTYRLLAAYLQVWLVRHLPGCVLGCAWTAREIPTPRLHTARTLCTASFGCCARAAALFGFHALRAIPSTMDIQHNACTRFSFRLGHAVAYRTILPYGLHAFTQVAARTLRTLRADSSLRRPHGFLGVG